MKNSFYGIYLILSLILFTFMFITGVTDEERNFVDNSVFLFLLLISTLNCLGSIILYTYHLKTQK